MDEVVLTWRPPEDLHVFVEEAGPEDSFRLVPVTKLLFVHHDDSWEGIVVTEEQM